jgi:putative aldouronate transport system substrate-binding protein
MKKNSFLALIAALALLISVCTGCGSTGTSTATADSGTDAAATAEASVEEKAESSAEAPVADIEVSDAEEASVEEVPEVLGPEAYYACDETTEITVLFQYAAWFQGFFPEGWGKSEFWTQLGEATNTTWSLQEIANMAWTENVNLLCAAGDLPDVVMNLGSVYNGGLVAAIRDEQIVDIAPLIEENAPNYYYYLTQDDYTLKSCITDDGEMGAMYPLTAEPDPIVDGLWIRQDWLDELNMEIPTTPDELNDVLLAFQSNFGANVGFYQMIRTGDTTIGPQAEGVWNAYGPVNYYLDEDGVIQSAFMQDYYFEYLAFLQKLANEGLFLTSTMTDKDASELFASGEIGIEGDSITNVPSYISLLPEEEQAKINLVPMAALGEPSEYGSTTSLISGSNSGGGNVSISTNCDDPTIVLKALDYLYTDVGSMLSIWGIEGVSYEYDENGDPYLTDVIMNNPDGIPVNAALGYWCNPGIPGLGNAERTMGSWDDVQKSAPDIWASAYTGSSATVGVDGLSLTEEEQDSISVFKSDMKTYADEWINNVIFNNGDLSDAAIQDFRDYLQNTLHLDEILDVYNAAYARFEARSLN